MAELFNRDIRLTAGPLTISPRTTTGEAQAVLAVEFDVVKTMDRAANTASISIWNLKEANRTVLQEKGIELVLEAGYVDEVVELFKGDIDKTTIRREATDWVVTLETLDGGRALKSARVNKSLRGPQGAGNVLKQAAEALGLDIGNLKEQVSADGARSVLKQFVSGVVLSGKAEDVVAEVASSLGLNFSVQSKKLQFLPTSGSTSARATSEPPAQLNSTSGLIGSPSIGEKGTVKAASLLNGRITPGRRVTLQSAVVSGTFIAQKVHHKGATWGADWTTSLELLP